MVRTTGIGWFGSSELSCVLCDTGAAVLCVTCRRNARIETWLDTNRSCGIVGQGSGTGNSRNCQRLIKRFMEIRMKGGLRKFSAIMNGYKKFQRRARFRAAFCALYEMRPSKDEDGRALERTLEDIGRSVGLDRCRALGIAAKEFQFRA